MAINANGTSSKPGDWNGGGASGAGSYQEPGQRSSYDSKGNQVTNFQGQNVAGGKNSGSGSIAQAVTAPPPVKKKKPVAPPLRKRQIKGLFGGVPRWKNPGKVFPSRAVRDEVWAGDVIPDYGTYTPPGQANVTDPGNYKGFGLVNAVRSPTPNFKQGSAVINTPKYGYPTPRDTSYSPDKDQSRVKDQARVSQSGGGALGTSRF